MTTSNLSKLGLSELIKTYRDAASEHRAACDAGDYRIANRNAKTIIAAEKEFDRRGGDAKRAILVLLDDADEGVRCSAAGYAMDFAPEEATPVLVKIAANPRGSASLAAGVVLERHGIIEAGDE